mgnify:CR=1 FL=1
MEYTYKEIVEEANLEYQKWLEEQMKMYGNNFMETITYKGKHWYIIGIEPKHRKLEMFKEMNDAVERMMYYKLTAGFGDVIELPCYYVVERLLGK